MIANVTYGYTAASFSGRMPCVEVADAIVQTARRTLERAVRWVESEVAGAEVVYGDTDSLFVHLPGRSKEEAFEQGARIAREVTRQNPHPVELQMDKVYYPCCLVSKKRYVGHAWQAPEDAAPVFDAKGIETVRRDQCAATQRLLRGSLETFFRSGGDLSPVKAYLQEHAERLRSGRFSLQDFVFHHEVRPPDEYRGQGPLAAQAVRRDGGPWPSPGQRVPFVVAEGPPGSRLRDVAVHPREVVGGSPPGCGGPARAPPLHLDVDYYLERQIGPVLQRLFVLLRSPSGAAGVVNVRRWLSEGPRPRRRDVAASAAAGPTVLRALAARGPACEACGAAACGAAARRPRLCGACGGGQAVPRLAEALWRRRRWEARVQQCSELCLHCAGSAQRPPIAATSTATSSSGGRPGRCSWRRRGAPAAGRWRWRTGEPAGLGSRLRPWGWPYSLAE
ncbi:unnamed protein product [Prorocentrum cordatum]|uniref:DNA-directed DNA polymerase n=1 Tax=Prorocentrum cordatum TaxID=2364126 RepID=A0ABN9TME3_9DINO|nr:unnamed protein product [Polarella glacialis]